MGARTRRGLPLSNGGLLPNIAPPGNGHQVSYKPSQSAGTGMPIHLSFANGEEGTAEVVDCHQEAKNRDLVLRDPGWCRKHSRPTLVFESEALAIDTDDDRVVQWAIEHRASKHAVAGEGSIPNAEGQVLAEDRFKPIAV